MVFDTAIIGGGQAGVPLARGLADAGQKVALIERVHLGGSCVNFGCTPSKAFIASAQAAHDARRAGELGIRVPTIDVDFAAVLRRVRQIAADARGALDDSLADVTEPQVIRGHGRLAGRDGSLFRIAVGDRIVLARDVVLDTGTRSLLPDIPGLNAVEPVTAENWIDLQVLPRRLIIIGGSYLALEFGQAFRRLGSEIVLLQSGPQLAEREDDDVSEAIRKILAGEGIDIRLSSKIIGVETIAGGVRVQVEGGAIEGSHLMIATGRRPNTGDLGLDSVGVTTDEKGMIEVDERLATRVAGICAAGDIRGGPAFAHTAYADFGVLQNQLAGDRKKTTNGRIVPYGMFMEPELGRVGLTEAEARRLGHTIRVGRREMSSSGKAKELNRTDGFVKVVIDDDTDRILGASCLCHAGTEVVQTFIALMSADAAASVMREAIHIHPTITEAAKNALIAAG